MKLNWLNVKVYVVIACINKILGLVSVKADKFDTNITIYISILAFYS